MSRARCIVAWAVVLAILLAGAFVGVAAGQSEVTLEITVVDGDGDPVDGVDVTATWDDGDATGTTASNGKVLLDVPDGADVEVTTEHTLYVRNRPYQIEDASGGDVEVSVVRAGSATIEVVDADGAVDDAIVRLRQDGELVVNRRAGDDGVLETALIERDEYDLTVYTEGYRRNRTTLTVDGSVDRTVRIREGSEVVSVSVRDDHFDPPRGVRNATVSVGNIGSVQTLSEGEATISVPVNDDYEVTVEKEGYESTTTTVEVGEEPLERNVSIQRTPAINVTAANDRVVVGESVRVTVVDEYGDAVAGADVSVDGSSVGSTNDAGELDVPIETAGEHDVEATADSLSASATVEGVEPGEATATTTRNATGTTTSEGGPGFTVAGAIAAMIAAGLLARRR